MNVGIVSVDRQFTAVREAGAECPSLLCTDAYRTENEDRRRNSAGAPTESVGSSMAGDAPQMSAKSRVSTVYKGSPLRGRINATSALQVNLPSEKPGPQGDCVRQNRLPGVERTQRSK